MSFKTLFLKKIYPSVFVCVDYHFEQEYGFKYTPGEKLESGAVLGSSGGVQSAIGIVGIFDSRDNLINSYKGSLLEISSYFYSQNRGSTFNFTYVNELYQKFWQVKAKHIIALQAKVRYGFGEVPFLDV